MRQLVSGDCDHVTDGDDDALVRVLYPRLFRYAAVVGASWQDPDDLVHDALVATLRAHSLSELDHPLAYLRRGILSAAMRRQRRSGLFQRAAAVLVPTDGQDPFYDSDLADLEHLDARDRGVLFLVHVEGLSYAEAGSELGMTEATCRQRAHRARHRLRTAIEAEEARHAR